MNINSKNIYRQSQKKHPAYGHRRLANEIWASDLTYLKYQEKFLYLSAIQDIATKEVVACNLGDSHDSEAKRPCRIIL